MYYGILRISKIEIFSPKKFKYHIFISPITYQQSTHFRLSLRLQIWTIFLFPLLQELLIMQLVPSTRADEPAFATLHSYLAHRDRIGVCEMRPKHVKDLYICPVDPKHPLSPILFPFNGPGTLSSLLPFS